MISVGYTWVSWRRDAKEQVKTRVRVLQTIAEVIAPNASVVLRGRVIVRGGAMAGTADAVDDDGVMISVQKVRL